MSFSGQSFWIVGFDETKKLKIEEDIQHYGGFISSILRSATRVIFLDPLAMSEDTIPDFVKAFSQAEIYNTLTETCISLAEGWIHRSIKEEQLPSEQQGEAPDTDGLDLSPNLGISGKKDMVIWVVEDSDDDNVEDVGSVDDISSTKEVESEDEEDKQQDFDVINDDGILRDASELQEEEEHMINSRNQKSSRTSRFKGNYSTKNKIKDQNSKVQNKKTKSLKSKSKLTRKAKIYPEVDQRFQNRPYNGRWLNQPTVQPKDQVAFNALVEDLKKQVKENRFNTCGLFRHLAESSNGTYIYCKYRLLVRDQVPGLPPPYNTGC